jgi:hypothetical protein
MTKDKFGLSWQVVPTALTSMLTDETSEASQRAFEAMLQMKRLDIEELKRAYEGGVGGTAVASHPSQGGRRKGVITGGTGGAEGDEVGGVIPQARSACRDLRRRTGN